MKSACTAGNGQSTLVVKAKGKTVMNKFPKLVAIKKDNSNATEHYSYLFELFVASMVKVPIYPNFPGHDSS